MSLFDLLPPPKYSNVDEEEDVVIRRVEKTKRAKKVKIRSIEVPSYPNRTTKTFIPKNDDDFENGGAFPEIHVTQYPLQMGMDGTVSTLNNSMSILPYNVNEKGEQDITSLVFSGHRKDKVIFSSIDDIIGISNTENLQRPSEDEEAKILEETRNDISKRVNFKIAIAHNLKSNESKERKKNMQKYYKIQSFDNKNTQRIVQIVDEIPDPIEPPKFKSKRLHRIPPSPPVPILHSPKRKMKKDDRDNWKIPPCISNWKNPKGYTIPLDKRLAADGRGLRQTQMNDKFAKFAESLYVAEQTAREEIDQRQKYQEAMLLRQKEEEEEKLRKLAMQARKERMDRNNKSRDIFDSDSDSDSDDDNIVRERDDIRREVHRDMRIDRRRELRRKKKKHSYDDDDNDDRDISEKIALGMAPKSGSGMDDIDTRLFEQAGKGIGQGLHSDMNIYDKPMRNIKTQIYSVDERRMKDNVGDISEYNNINNFEENGSNTNNVRKKLGRFDNHDKEKRRGRNEYEDDEDEKRDRVKKRTGPVLFERKRDIEERIREKKDQEKKRNESKKNDDPFAFLSLVDNARRGVRANRNEDERNENERGNVLGKRSRSTFMGVVGGSSNNREYYKNSKKRKIEFSKGKR